MSERSHAYLYSSRSSKNGLCRSRCTPREAGFCFARGSSTDIDVRLTAGRKRFSQEPGPRWVSASCGAADAVILEPIVIYHEILGFGAASPDAAWYMLNALDARTLIASCCTSPSAMRARTLCRCCGWPPEDQP